MVLCLALAEGDWPDEEVSPLEVKRNVELVIKFHPHVLRVKTAPIATSDHLAEGHDGPLHVANRAGDADWCLKLVGHIEVHGAMAEDLDVATIGSLHLLS